MIVFGPGLKGRKKTRLELISAYYCIYSPLSFVGGQEAGAYLSSHWTWSGENPGQAASHRAEGRQRQTTFHTYCTFTPTGNSESPINQTCMSLDCRRKLRGNPRRELWGDTAYRTNIVFYLFEKVYLLKNKSNCGLLSFAWSPQT